MPPSDFFLKSWGYKHGSDYFFRKSVTPRSWIWSTVPSAGWPWSGKSSRLRRTTRNAWGITTASLPCSAIRRKATSKCCRSVHSVSSMQGPHHTHGRRLETCWACWALAEHGYPLTNDESAVICWNGNQSTGHKCLLVPLVVIMPGTSRQGLLAHRLPLVFKSNMIEVGQIALS